MPRPLGRYIHIRCFRCVLFCLVGGLEGLVTWRGLCSPIRVPLFLIPARCRGASRLVLLFVALAGSCFSRLPALARVPMGSSFAHERSTTFPWVASRPVQRGYDLSGLRGPVVRLYHYIRGIGVRSSVVCHLVLRYSRCCRICRRDGLVGRMV